MIAAVDTNVLIDGGYYATYFPKLRLG